MLERRTGGGSHTAALCRLPRAQQLGGAQYIFGLFACFLLLRTGHLWAAFSAHSLCNLMGLPKLSFMYPESELGFLHGNRHAVLLAYAVGITAFCA
eukprot:COSAG01_NODE_4452_length_5007_cov_1.898737_2_plen_96_part_00